MGSKNCGFEIYFFANFLILFFHHEIFNFSLLSKRKAEICSRNCISFSVYWNILRGERRARRKPTVPWLHPEHRGQQVKGRDSALVRSACSAASALGSQQKKDVDLLE